MNERETLDLVNLMEWNRFAEEKKTLLEALTILNNRHREAVSSIERERDEARERASAMDRLHIARMTEMNEELSAMREAIKEAHEALQACMEDSGELLAEHDWWKDEPRCGYQERYEENKQRIENAKTALAKLQSFLTDKT